MDMTFWILILVFDYMVSIFSIKRYGILIYLTTINESLMQCCLRYQGWDDVQDATLSLHIKYIYSSISSHNENWMKTYENISRQIFHWRTLFYRHFHDFLMPSHAKMRLSPHLWHSNSAFLTAFQPNYHHNHKLTITCLKYLSIIFHLLTSTVLSSYL